LDQTVEHFLDRYASKGVLIDTNLLLVYLIGTFDRSFLQRFPRTQNYTSNDYDILSCFLERFHRVIVTPHILTEVSNLSLQALKDPYAEDFFASMAHVLGSHVEKHIPKERILPSPHLARFGFTDLSIQETARELRCLVLSDDLRLVVHLGDCGLAAANFTSIRIQSG